MFEPIEGDKQCARCQQCKPLSQFSPRSDRPGRRHPTCKACRNEHSKARYQAKRASRPRRLTQAEPAGWPTPTHDYTAPDFALRNYSYPVERGPLVPNLGMSVPNLEMVA